MDTKFTRDEILQSLHTTLSKNEPIITAGCSAGIIAKCAELGGADLIVVYSTGKSRLMGLPTSRLGDSNAVTLMMADEILNVVKDAPVIGGVEATDPTRLDIRKLLLRFVDAGYSGVINFPTIGIWPDLRLRGDKINLGFKREVELIRLAHQMDIFTMAYVATSEDADMMVEAGVDCLVAHTGPTQGGLVGFRYEGTLEAAADRVTEILRVAEKKKGDVICLAHGGPVSTPADTSYIYKNTPAQGFVAASSIERIPVEEAVYRITRRFKHISLINDFPEIKDKSESLASGVHHFSLCVSDIKRSLSFYVGLIGCTLISYRPSVKVDFVRKQVDIPDAELGIAFLDAFGQILELIQYVHPLGSALPSKRYDVGAAHVAFSVKDALEVYERLKSHNVKMISEPQYLKTGPNKGGYAFYVLDPDGITVELFQLPR